MDSYIFAGRIYCAVFKIEEVDGDIYLDGVINAINSLSDREQIVLEYYY